MSLLNSSPQNKPTEWKKMISSPPNTINFQVSHLIFQSIHLFELSVRVPLDWNTRLCVQGQGCHTIASPMAKRNIRGGGEMFPLSSINNCQLFIPSQISKFTLLYLFVVCHWMRRVPSETSHLIADTARSRYA